MEVLLDGKRVQVPEDSRLSDLLPDRDPRFSVAVIRPVLEEEAESQEVRFVTTAGDMVVEVADPALVSRLFRPGCRTPPALAGPLRAAFGRLSPW